MSSLYAVLLWTYLWNIYCVDGKNQKIITSLQFPLGTGCLQGKKVKFSLLDLCGVSDTLLSQQFYLWYVTCKTLAVPVAISAYLIPLWHTHFMANQFTIPQLD
jgi:hypothetical protein